MLRASHMPGTRQSGVVKLGVKPKLTDHHKLEAIMARKCLPSSAAVSTCRAGRFRGSICRDVPAHLAELEHRGDWFDNPSGEWRNELWLSTRANVGNARSCLCSEAIITVIFTITPANTAVYDNLRTKFWPRLTFPKLIAHSASSSRGECAILLWTTWDSHKTTADGHIVRLVIYRQFDG